MSQHPALSLLAVEAAEELEDAVVACAADGVIDPHELVYLRSHVRLVVVRTQEVDVAQAAGLAVMRGGTASCRASRLLREVGTWQPEEAA
jgi:hypothetical protein